MPARTPEKLMNVRSVKVSDDEWFLLPASRSPYMAARWDRCITGQTFEKVDGKEVDGCWTRTSFEIHNKSLLDVSVPPCFMPPLVTQARAYPTVARYTPLRGFQRVRWAPLRCTLLVHHVSNHAANLRARVSALHAKLTQRVLRLRTRLRDASDWLLTEQAHGGVRQV